MHQGTLPHSMGYEDALVNTAAFYLSVHFPNILDEFLVNISKYLHVQIVEAIGSPRIICVDQSRHSLLEMHRMKKKNEGDAKEKFFDSVPR